MLKSTKIPYAEMSSREILMGLAAGGVLAFLMIFLANGPRFNNILSGAISEHTTIENCQEQKTSFAANKCLEVYNLKYN